MRMRPWMRSGTAMGTGMDIGTGMRIQWMTGTGMKIRRMVGTGNEDMDVGGDGDGTGTVMGMGPRDLTAPARRSPSATRRQELKGLVQPHHQAAADISMEMSRFWD